MTKKIVKLIVCLNLAAAGAVISGNNVCAEELDPNEGYDISAADELVNTEDDTVNSADETVNNADDMVNLSDETIITDDETIKNEFLSKYDLPSSVDLRKRGMVSKVRNQGDLGTCWAHASLGTIENSLLESDPDADLSEMYLAYMVSRELGGEVGEGHSFAETAAFLANWIGPVYEYTAPYDEEYSSSLSREEVMKEAVLHLKNSHYLPAPYTNGINMEGILEIRKALNEGHSLSCSIIHFDTSMFFNSFTNAFFSAGESSPEDSHAIEIVGYDDNFPSDLFLSDPGMNGAWLMKNSWDTSFGDNGYFWVSYCEQLEYVMYYDVEYAEEHDKLYSYDDYGINGVVSETEEGEESVWGSNIFTASENGFITDVMLLCVNPGDVCEISVYTGLKNESDPVSGKAGKVTEAVLDGKGYRTVKLCEPVYTGAGEKFAVVVKYSGKKGYHIGCEYSYSSDYDRSGDEDTHYVRAGIDSFDIETFISEDMIKETFEKNQSFYSTDGNSWTDMADVDENDRMLVVGNISIKAMAVKESKVWFSDYGKTVKKGTAVELSTPDNRNIYYSVNGSDFVLYREPVTVDEDMCISAYAEGSESDIYSHFYTVRKAKILSMLIGDTCGNVNKEYADFSDDNSFLYSVNREWEYIDILPITSGKIEINGEKYGSGEMISLGVPERTEDKIYKIIVSEEGLSDTEYTLTLRNETLNSFSGMYFSEKMDRVYYFDEAPFNEDEESRDTENTGYYLDTADKKRTDFSYSISGRRITMKKDGKVIEGDIASDYRRIMISWDNGETEDLDKTYDEISEIYSYDELAEMVKAHYEYMFNKTPKSVKTFAEDFETVKISVEDEKGTVSEYYVNILSAVGVDNDDKCIDFSAPAKDTGIYEVKKGTWISKVTDDYYSFLYFEGNGEDYTEYDIYSFRADPVKYHIDNRQIEFTYEYGSDNGYIVINDDDTMTISHQGNNKRNYRRISEESLESIYKYSLSDLECMVAEYEENMFCRRVLTKASLTGTDTAKVEVNMPDHYICYYISLKNAEGTNQDGEAVNLREYSNPDESVRFSGVWKYYRDSTYNGFISFSQDSQELIWKNIDGIEKKYSYKACGNYAVLVSEPEKIFVEFRFDGKKITVVNIDGESSIELEYQSNGDFNSFKFYSVDELLQMAVTDYEKEINKTGCTNDYFIKNDNITIAVFDISEDGHQMKVYHHVDPVTGMAYDEHKTECYNLPQTGLSSPLYLFEIAGAFLSMAAGAIIALFSGKSLKKKE